MFRSLLNWKIPDWLGCSIVLVALSVWFFGCGKPPQPPFTPSTPPAIPKRATAQHEAAHPADHDPLQTQVTMAQLSRFEKRLAALEEILVKAEGERDDLLARLRGMGVKSSADLKSNPQARAIAETLQRVVREIVSLQRDATRFGEAISQTKTLLRQIDRAKTLEGAGVNDDELAKLSEQTMDLLGGETASGPADPIRQADLLDQELQRKASSSRKLSPRQAGVAARIVGKWELTEGKRTGSVEFTAAGTALLSWNDGLTNGLGERGRRATLKYTLAGNTLRLQEPGTSEYRQKCDVEIEFVGDDELIFINQKNSLSFDWLDGRARRPR